MKRNTLKSNAPKAEPTAGGDILNEDDAGRYLGGVSPRTLRLWRMTRGLPHFRLTSKVIRYRKTELDAWVNRTRTAIAA